MANRPPHCGAQIVAGGVGAPDDGGEMVECRIPDAVDAQDGVEGAALAFVGEFDSVDVVRRSANLIGDVENGLGGNVDELRLRIDEAPDQPRTGDAVDLRTLARDPFARRRADRAAGRQPVCDPAGDAILQIDRVEPGRAQRGSHASADLMAMNAVHDDLARAGQGLPPLVDLVRRTMAGGHEELARVGKICGAPNVDHGRSGGSAEPGIKIGRGHRRKSLLHDNSPRLPRRRGDIPGYRRLFLKYS